MGYLFLFLALCFGLVKAYCGKRSSSAAVHISDAVLINTFRMILCFAIGIILVLISRTPFAAAPQAVLISLICGVGTACFTVSWLLAVHTMAYMMVEVFVMGGTLIPLTLCAVLYGDRIGWVQIVGILLLLAAVYCMCTYKKKEDFKITLKSLGLLILCALSSGISDFSQKLYIREIEDADISLFNLYTYLFAASVLLIACFIFRTKEKNKYSLKPPRDVVMPILGYVVIMAFCLFLNSYFKTLAAGYLDAVLLYPLSQGLSVALSLFMSVILFKEKINAKGITGVILSLLSLILINVFGAA